MLLVLVPRAFAGVEISEFLAENQTGITDEDGDRSDWIELTNFGPEAVDLGGWRLTDSVSNRSKWKFPAGVVIPQSGRLIVFASSKNRAVAGKPLHTNFSLRLEGEYLALFPPVGAVPATAFDPAYPPQRADVSFGVGFRETPTPLVPFGAPARIAIPVAGDNHRAWTGSAADEPYDDSAWLKGTSRVGFDDLAAGGQAAPLLGYWNFDDVQQPKVARDLSGRGQHGALIGAAVLGGLGSGFTGRPGDRALDLGTGAANASVRIDGASQGGFDALEKLDRATISLWAFGGPQLPMANCAFWFDSGIAGADARNLMVHLPWSDQAIYFDTAGCCGADTRVSRVEPDPNRWKGRWNHYVFLKDGRRKEIWQNGVLWASGDSAIPLKGVKSLWLGSAPGGTSPYPGKLDDIGVWAAALKPEDIRRLYGGASPLAIGSYLPHIDTGLGGIMQGKSAQARLRIPFVLPPGAPPSVLSLRLRYDDGFTAWLNGVEIARDNVPATVDRPKPEAVEPVTFAVRDAATLLRTGSNILAIEGVNDSVTGPDFLLNAELRGAETLAARFFVAPTPGTANPVGVANLTDEPTVTPGRRFLDAPTDVRIACPTPGAYLRYTLDGSEPSEVLGILVQPAGPASSPSTTVTIAKSTVVRVRAFRDDFEPSTVQTHTYLFARQVQEQGTTIPGYPVTWGVYGNYGPKAGQPMPADYAMDPKVTGTTTAGYGVTEAILSLPAVCISTSISNLFDAATGLYPNSAVQGSDWVRPGSAELIFPDGKPGFQIDAGVRIHGGLSRQHWHSPKHSFRLGFERQFGPTRLKFRLYDDTRVTSFNELTLRASSTDSWTVEDSGAFPRPKATYMRDVWMKDTQQAMGWPCGHSRYVHLFLDGVYWGQYNLAERTEPGWLAENLGGAPEDYDIVKDGGEVESGNRAIWDTMIAQATAGLGSDAAYWLIQGRKPDGTRDPALPIYLNVDSLIDYMILHIYAGAVDWPNHNWWSARRRGELSEGFRFYTWDQEISNLSLSTATTFPGERFESVSGPPDSPAFLYSKLRSNTKFRQRFSDRVIALTTGLGILTPAQNSARWLRRQEEIDRSIVAESARWGDSRQSTPFKRSHWISEMNWMRTQYWPGIHNTAVQRFRDVGLYSGSSVPAVTLSPAGGIVNPGVNVTLSGGPNIFYTLNGVNPIAADGSLAKGATRYTDPIAVNSAVEIRAQRSVAGGWTAPVSAFYLPTTKVAPPSAFAVTEVHYHPRESELEEFIEVKNLSADQYVVLGGARLSGGIDYVFPNNRVLPPGRMLVVARDPAVFRARYGDNFPVEGPFAGQLANDGDRVHLLAASGAVVARVEYRPKQPWPEAADGEGRSLTLIQPDMPVDASRSESWRPSSVDGGTPGKDDFLALPGSPLVDADHDGLTAIEEYFLGSSDSDAASGPSRSPRMALDADGAVTLSVERALGSDRVAAVWEQSADLQTWEPVVEWSGRQALVVEDREQLVWHPAVETTAHRFYRLRLTTAGEMTP